ncbi:MAG: Qat anti-phage system associated protein QatB [Halarcobacter sp.]
MGTSTSSGGPGPGVSMDPPWLDDLGSELPSLPNDGNTEVPNDDKKEPKKDNPNQEVAPPRRFADARRYLGNYARSGDRTSFRKSMGHYSKTGMGGAQNISKRMRVSTKATAGLVSFINDVKNEATPEISDWHKNLISKNPTPNEIIDAIVQRVTNEGGTLDEDSIKNSMTFAMSEMLTTDPDIDLLNMGSNEVWTLIENVLSYEAKSRIELDIGQIFESSKLTPVQQVERSNEMYEYLKAEIVAQIKPFREKDPDPEITRLDAIMRQAIENTFAVFEEEIE